MLALMASGPNCLLSASFIFEMVEESFELFSAISFNIFSTPETDLTLPLGVITMLKLAPFRALKGLFSVPLSFSESYSVDAPIASDNE
ncbi:hypothetical protein D3C78_1505690 [compost metagenome]